MRKALRAISTFGVLLCLSCGGSANNGLSVVVIPTQPVAIPYGTTTVLGNPVTAPYFLLNSVNLTWVGANGDSLEVVTILMQTPPNYGTTPTGGTTTTNTPVTCGISGDQLAAAYPNYNNNGNVVLPPGVTATSGPMPCSGFTLPTPLPTSLAIPIQVEVIGVLIDGNGNAAGRVQQTQNITVQ
jgi:hypothetical protein